MLKRMIFVMSLVAMLMASVVPVASAQSSLPGQKYYDDERVEIVQTPDIQSELRRYDRSQPFNRVFESPAVQVKKATQHVPIKQQFKGQEPPPVQAYWKIFVSDDLALVLVCKYNDDGDLEYCDVYF